ncbi:MAG: glycosyltransferase, partial [Thermoleophilaceae bacterium]|nr:glycosyltransferase [Thermoleophilaceae bacterium]
MAGQSLRVALLNPCFWPEVRRGSERFARELADGLIGRGHRPTLITSHPGRFAITEEDRLNVIRLPRPPDGRLLRRGYEDHMTHAPLSYLLLRLMRFDIAHALFSSDAVAAARWAKATGRPAVYSNMGVPERPELVRRRRRLELLE